MSVVRGGDGRAPRTLAERVIITRLGRGVDADGCLRTDAIERSLEALRELVRDASAHGGKRVAVGTSALRDARNAADFLEPAHTLLGAPVEIIAGAREAELTFRGALSGLDVSEREATVVDVGGGSTELVQRAPSGELVGCSLDIGCVRLTERFGTGDAVDADRLRALTRAVDAALDAASIGAREPLVANSGTATTLAAMAGRIEPYDAERVHGSRLEARWLDAELERLAAEPPALRAQSVGLPAQRADVIVAGAAILSRLCARSGADELFVSDRGVRMGLALEIIEEARIDPTT
jgi:exopolyphosphatase/guanosine-5'-triphosphate,3'-diphosphate pyrophosphatase